MKTPRTVTIELDRRTAEQFLRPEIAPFRGPFPIDEVKRAVEDALYASRVNLPKTIA